MKVYTGRVLINFRRALLSYTKFGLLTGIKSAREELDFKDWTEKDRGLWHKNFSKTVGPRTFIHLTFLSTENLYFVKTSDDKFFTPREDFKTNEIHSFTVAGDFDGFKPCIDFILYQRQIKNKRGKDVNVLVPCLKYIEEHFSSDRNHFKPLCEIPNFNKDDSITDYGFEDDDQFGDFKNDFGEDDYFTSTTYKKDGVEVIFS